MPHETQKHQPNCRSGLLEIVLRCELAHGMLELAQVQIERGVRKDMGRW